MAKHSGIITSDSCILTPDFCVLNSGFLQKKSPAPNNAGLQKNVLKWMMLCRRSLLLFSRLFYVAASRLNSPRLYQGAYTLVT